MKWPHILTYHKLPWFLHVLEHNFSKNCWQSVKHRSIEGGGQLMALGLEPGGREFKPCNVSYFDRRLSDLWEEDFTHCILFWCISISWVRIKKCPREIFILKMDKIFASLVDYQTKVGRWTSRKSNIGVPTYRAPGFSANAQWRQVPTEWQSDND